MPISDWTSLPFGWIKDWTDAPDSPHLEQENKVQGPPAPGLIESTLKPMVDYWNESPNLRRFVTGELPPGYPKVMPDPVLSIPGTDWLAEKASHAIDPSDKPFYTGAYPLMGGMAKTVIQMIGGGIDPRAATLRSPRPEVLPPLPTVTDLGNVPSPRGLLGPAESTIPQDLHTQSRLSAIGQEPAPVEPSIGSQFLGDESGTFDPQQMWENLKQLLGRDPTEEEVQQGLARQIRPGESTGRVASFARPEPLPIEPTYGSLPEDAHSSPYGPETPENTEFPDNQDTGFRSFPAKGTPGSEEVTYLSDIPQGPDDFTVPSDRPTNDISGIRQGNVLGPSSTNISRPPEIPLEKWNTLDDNQKSQYLRDKEELDYGYPAIRPSLEQWNLPNTTPSFGPRGASPEDIPIPVQEGQQELPWSRGVVDQPIDADAYSREMQSLANRFKKLHDKILEQLSMEGQMKDAEINDYLKREDARPPESDDLDKWRPLK